MLRIPPHLQGVVILFLVVLFVMMLNRFRKSVRLQKFVAETIGEDTPETALVAFNKAKIHLQQHLADTDMPAEVRSEIEQALGVPVNSDVQQQEV